MHFKTAAMGGGRIVPFPGGNEKYGQHEFSPGFGNYYGRVSLVSRSFQCFRDVSRTRAGNSAPLRARATRSLTISFQMSENCSFLL